VLRRLLGLSLVVLLTSLGSAAAATWHVSPDGSGDVATIAAAVTAAASGDTVLLANGTFEGDGNRNIEIDKGIVILSASGDPTLCIIDCNGTLIDNECGFDITFVGSPYPVIAGLTIREGFWGAGGAIRVFPSTSGDCSPFIVNCRFLDNYVSAYGGAVYAHTGATVSIIGCLFSGNSTASTGGALAFGSGSSGVVNTCHFGHNASGSNGGAVHANGATVGFTACTFDSNTAGTSGGAIYGTNSAFVIVGCTLVANAANSGGGLGMANSTCNMVSCVSCRNSAVGGAGVYLSSGDQVTITSSTFAADSVSAYGNGVIEYGVSTISLTLQHCIIAFAATAWPVSCHGHATSPTVTCCDFYGNTAGDWTDCVTGLAGTGGNFSSNPKFCDVLAGNVQLQGCSPCLADNNTCGVDIGALGSGCDCGGATEPTTWGAVKAMFKK
jgi:predicted outer membrane repeat protein